MPSISLPVAALAGAGISAAGSLGGAAISAGSAQAAANTQLKMFNTIQGQEAPFRTFGQTQLGPLGNLLSGNPQTVNATLEQLPGYQFSLYQGEKSVGNGLSARGLGAINPSAPSALPSGAVIKGAEGYATGLASQTYQGQVQNLLSAAGLGQDAAASTGWAGTNLAGTASQYQAGVGSTLGAGLQAATSPFAYQLMRQGANPFVANGTMPADLAGVY